VHNEITFDLLYTILVPCTLIVARCAVTGLERLFHKMKHNRCKRRRSAAVRAYDVRPPPP
jgi:hypothetical protein